MSLITPIINAFPYYEMPPILGEENIGTNIQKQNGIKGLCAINSPNHKLHCNES